MARKTISSAGQSAPRATRGYRLFDFPAQSPDVFRQNLKSVLFTLDCQVPEPSTCFAVSMEGVRLGSSDLLKYDGHGLKGGRRSFRQVSEDGIDDFLLAMPLSAPLTVSQSGLAVAVEPGQFTLLTTTKPFENVRGSGPAYTSTEIILRLPGPLLRRQVPNIDDCCVKTISAQSGGGRILRSLIDSILLERNNYSVAQGARLEAILMAAVGNAVLDSPDLVKPEADCRHSAHVRIFESARIYIESHLSDPGLNPAMVAGHCQVSLGYLHSVFASYSLSPWAFIRSLRLQRCREALHDASLRNQSIIQIAMRWGFGSSVAFNRAYHAAFGTSPSEDRKRRFRVS